MSDPRYRKAVLQGIKLARRPGAYPDRIPGYGVRHGGQPLADCALCPPEAPPVVRLTFVRYGGTPLCLKHAISAQDWQRGPHGPVCSWPGSWGGR